MNYQLFNKIGDWNPQLFRELKGRLKFRNVAIAFLIALLAQGFLLFSFFNKLQLRKPTYSNYATYGDYCAHISTSYNECALPVTIDWIHWWSDQFRILSWGIPLVLMTGGVYFLVSDLTQEQRRGTLNFIRLSPQSSRSILLGKLLGVPVLNYLATAFVIPLHVWSGISAGVSLDFFLSYYLIIGVGCYFAYSLALLCAFLIAAPHGNSLYQAGAGLGLSILALFFGQSYLIANMFTTWSQFPYLQLSNNSRLNIEWFYLPISHNIWVSHLFMLATLGVGISAIWFALHRSFHNPNATVINKSRSYFLVPFVEILALGFFVRHTQWPKELLTSGLVALYALNFIAFLTLIAILTPHRQTLLDWARYRHMSRSSIIQDLLWSEKSPAILAIAVNLLIAAVILTPWLVFRAGTLGKFFDFTINPMTLVIGMIATGVLILIYAAIAQLALFMKTPRRQLWAVGILGTLIFLPPLTLLVLLGDPAKHSFIWMLLGSPWIAIASPSFTLIFGAIATHLAVLATLGLVLRQKLLKAGESEFKAMQSSSRAIAA